MKNLSSARTPNVYVIKNMQFQRVTFIKDLRVYFESIFVKFLATSVNKVLGMRLGYKTGIQALGS